MILKSEMIQAFSNHLKDEEKSCNTVNKYLRDVEAFSAFVGNRPLTKECVIGYKDQLIQGGYAVRSINSMLASVNSLLQFLGMYECRVRTIRVQRQIYCPEAKELSKTEYLRLVNAAQSRGSARTGLILETICGTGIRVSELCYITVEAAKRGEAIVTCKGKIRTVFLVRELQKKLLRYSAEQGIESGCIFVTKSGKPLDRTNIWRDMKTLCEKANVDPEKVYPHNLRHLFARVFYGLEKDIAKLADILGHSSINTTRVYIISTGVEHRRRMERMCLIT